MSDPLSTVDDMGTDAATSGNTTRCNDVVAGVIARLHTAIDDVVALVADGVTAEDLHHLTIGLDHQRARLTVATADTTVAWERTRIWRDDGSRSPAARLAHERHRDPGTVGRELARARDLAAMPHVRAGVLAGRLSLDDVDTYRRTRHDAPDLFTTHEAGLITACAHLDHHDTRTALDYWQQRHQPEACERAADRRRARTHLHASATLDGTIAVTGTLDPVNGTIVTNELDRLARELLATDRASGITRSASQRRAAALVTMATRSASIENPTAPGTARPLVTILVGDDTARHLCELSTGTVITPGDVLHHLHHALVETVIFDGPTHLIATTGRRTFTGALRRGIQVRDRHCTHPGCHHPADTCDVDHTIPYAHRPVTDQHGGRLRCPAHNRTDLARHHRPTTITTRPDPTPLDHLRAIIRWRTHTHWTLDDDPDPDPEAEVR